MTTAGAGEERGRNEGKTGRGRAKEARRAPETAGGNAPETARGRKEKTGGRRACPKETGEPLRTLTMGLALKEAFRVSHSLPPFHRSVLPETVFPRATTGLGLEP